MSVKVNPGTGSHREGSNRSDTPLADELLTVTFCADCSVTADQSAVVEPCRCLRMELRVVGVGGLPEIGAGDDLAALIADAVALLDDDIVVVTSKVVSKAEGAVVDLATIEPSPFADDFAARWDKDPRVVEVVLRQAAAHRPDERTAADHRDAARLRVCQQRRRRVVERGGRARRRAPGRSGRFGPPACATASASWESTSP